jgi:hypothetical protein
MLLLLLLLLLLLQSTSLAHALCHRRLQTSNLVNKGR